MFDLRKPQKECCNAVYKDLRSVNAVLADVATGVGKTVIASALTAKWVSEGMRVLFLAHRDELIRQAVDKFWMARNVPAKVEKADEYAPLDAPVVVGSVQSLQRDRLARWPTNSFDVIITDEAHRSVADSYRSVYEHFDMSKKLGITATAYRQKGSLADIYEKISYTYGLKQAIEDGYLCNLIAQTAPVQVDMKSVGMRGGDYDETELADTIEPYLRRIADCVNDVAPNRKIILFAPTIDCSKKCRDIFEEEGFNAYHADGKDRTQLKDFEADGARSILCNSMLCTEGYDHPQIDCIIVLRATKSTGLYSQMIGRGTRLFPGKENCLVLDFLWNSENHNLCRAASLFAEDDETEKELQKILDKSGKPMDIGEAEIEAVTSIECERERRLADLLHAFKGRESKRFDPVLESLAVTDSRLANWKAETSWEKADVMYKQEQFLKQQGFDPSGWTRGYASLVIGDVDRRKRTGLCSPKQMRTLLRNGYPEAGRMTFGDAREAMDKLATTWKKAKRWKNIKADRRER